MQRYLWMTLKGCHKKQNAVKLATNLLTKVELKLHDLKVAVGYPNETQSFFQIRDRSVIVISKKDYPILYCSFLA